MPDRPSGQAAAAPDVFISYAREDRDTAQRLAEVLEQAGLAVWWDREILAGADFTRVIAENLAAARLVLVLWSETSAQSTFVRDESARARDAGKLLPVRIEEVELPLGFGQIHTLDLFDWDGEAEDPGLQALLAEIRHALKGGPRPRPLPPIRRWRWRRLAWVAVVVLVVAGGYTGWQWQQANSAERFFQQGIDAQFAREPNLEGARNHYLSALEIRPRHARTHFYLGHVYAQMQLLEDARDSFQEAVQLGRGLDAGQIRDAGRQLAALTVADEPAPLTRAVSARPAERPPAHAEAPRPAPPPVAARPPTSLPALAFAATTAARRLFTLPSDAGVVQRGGLPDLPPDAERQRRIEPLVAQVFAPAREARISATTSLVVDPELISDAVPLAIERAIAVQRASARGATDLAAARSGVINTLVLLRAASPVSLRKQGEPIRQLLDLARSNGPQTQALVNEVAQHLEKAGNARPVAWIQIADEAQRWLAERLAQRLSQAGFDVPGIENAGARAPARQGEIRSHGNSDQALARWQALAMGTVEGLRPTLTVLRKATPKVDTYEIWFDREICVSRRVAACE